MQYCTRNTTKKGVGQKPLPVGSKDNRIATFFVSRFQNLFYGMAQRNEDIGYQFNAWRTNLILYFLTKFLEVFLDFLKVRLPFLFFGNPRPILFF